MIERVARCLQQVGHVAHRKPTKPFRSRRHLHSAFWSHGAGNIDLPAWWILLLQTPIAWEESDRKGKHRNIGEAVSTGLQDIFLDFLYPVQTLALIRRLKRSTTAHQDAARKIQRYSRSYTSIAQDFIAGRDLGEIGYGDALLQKQEVRRGPQERINEILDASEYSPHLDELWQKYQDLLEDRQNLSPPQIVKMLRHLVLSTRAADHERAVALFESLPVSDRIAIHYSYGIAAALNLQDLSSAIDMHREAFSRGHGSIGTSSLLKCAVQHEDWSKALAVWYVQWDKGWAFYTRSEIWRGVEDLSLQELIPKATSALTFILSMSGVTSDRSTDAAREFAVELIRHVFCRKNASFDIHQHSILIRRAKEIDPSSSGLLTLALQQLLSIKSSEHLEQALHLYHDLKETATFSPTTKLLDLITDRSKTLRSSSGIKLVLRDWRQCYELMKASTYRKVAFMLARDGQLDALQELFEAFISNHGVPKDPWFYHYLLQTYHERADTEGILQCVADLRSKYNFVPDLKARTSVIATFARVDNVQDAVKYYGELKESGLRPDSNTYFHLMSMYARRGDRNAVQLLYEQAKTEGVPTSVGMIDALVQTHINDDRLEEAEELVSQALQIDSKYPRTFMWNILLKAYALRKDVDKVSQLHDKMQKANVPSNGITYANLMTSLTIAKYPDAAWKIMTDVLPRRKIKRTAMHYGVVMGGYLETREYSRIFQLYKAMLNEGLTPNMSTQNVLLRAAAAVDKEKPLALAEGSNAQTLVRAEQTLEQTLTHLDPGELATSETRQFVGQNPLDEAFFSSYFDYLIFTYGKEAAFTKASELFDRYNREMPLVRRSNEDVVATPSIRMLSALMATHLQAEDHKEIDRCWSLALEKSKKLARRSRSDDSRPRWVLYSRRYILNLPLQQYIESLDIQNRTADLIATVDNVCTAGYALTNANWNLYIQALARASRPIDQQLAFSHCDRHLMPNWSGWKVLGDPFYLKPKLQAASRNLAKQDQNSPSYLTLVWLAKVYLQAKSRGSSMLMRQLEKAGPKTMDAILNMPRLDDRPQSEILRGEV